MKSTPMTMKSTPQTAPETRACFSCLAFLSIPFAIVFPPSQAKVRSPRACCHVRIGER